MNRRAVLSLLSSAATITAAAAAVIAVFGAFAVYAAPRHPETTGHLKERFVLTDKYAYGIEPSELIGVPAIQSASWSPNSRFVLAVRERSPSRESNGEVSTDRSLVLWDAKSRRTDEVWRQPPGDSFVGETMWMHGIDVAVVNMVTSPMTAQPAAPPGTTGRPRELRNALLWVDCSSGRVRLLSDSDGSTALSIDPCPNHPIALLHRVVRTVVQTAPREGATRPAEQRQMLLQVVRASGTVGAPVAAPPEFFPLSTAWSQSGDTAYLSGVYLKTGATRRERVSFSFDLKTGAMAKVEKLPPGALSLRSDTEDSLPVTALQSKHLLKEGGTTRKIQSLWLRSRSDSPMNTALISPECDWSQLSPAGDAVLYLSKGAAWVASIDRLSLEEFDKLRQDAAMTDAKQAAVAILMYTQDYDEMFPLSDDVANRLFPYIKDDSVFQDFVFTSPGNGLADVKNPVDTIMGFVNGPGGRATIYVDGHVKWKPNP